jgi:Cu-Zn family superoxide dismutase
MEILEHEIPLRDTNISGLVVFEKIDTENVKLKYLIEGLTPGYHAFHIHEKGDCSGKDGKTTGKHLRLPDQEHGYPSKEMNHHTGDLPELYANKDGIAFGEVTLPGINFTDQDNGIIGRGMMIHLNPDHFTPEKVPNKRVACGVVQVANEAVEPSF